MRNGLNKMNKKEKNDLPESFLYTISQFSRLAKIPLCLMVGLSSGFGYFLAKPAFSPDLLLTTLAVFLLSCGAAAFNSLQEKETDAKYERTRHRPIVTGSISEQTALIFAITNCCAGSVILLLSGNTLVPFLLGLSALIIYNLVYTPLKPISEFALIPGGIAGALPPYIGWTSGGGYLFEPMIWGVMALFFLWQPPHFCLILLEYASEYQGKHNLKNLITRFSANRIKKIIAIWLLSFMCTVLFLTVLPGFLPQSARVILVITAPVFVLLFLLHLFQSSSPRYRILFVSLNSFLFSIMAVVTLSSLIGNS